MKLGIIADDFTGANDVALQLVKYGIKIKSFIKIEEIEGNFAYTTETRNVTETEAVKKLKKTFEIIKSKKIEKIYKKIDSTLRGNIRAEISMFLNSIDKNEKIAVILPFPKTGRTVKNGKLYVNGIELQNTEFAKDPYWKLSSSDLLNYFDGSLISLEDIRSENFSEILLKNNEQILVFEGETEEDLNLIAKQLVNNGLDKYVAGSSGVMEHLLYYWGYTKEKVLLVAGSCNPTNIGQINEFIEEFEPVVYDYFIDEDKITVSEGKEKDCIVLRTIREEKKSEKNRDELNLLISEKVKKICDKEKIKKIALSGGDISLAFMKRFNINRIEILSEIEPGIAFGITEEFQIITKPGGFGKEKIYKKIYSFMKNCR